MTNKIEGYVLKYSDGGFVAVDKDSGGYGFKTMAFSSAETWNSAEAAQNYANIFKGEKWTVHEVYVN